MKLLVIFPNVCCDNFYKKIWASVKLIDIDQNIFIRAAVQHFGFRLVAPKAST